MRSRIERLSENVYKLKAVADLSGALEDEMTPPEAYEEHDYIRIVDLVGREAAEKLLQEFQGSSVYFPKQILRHRVHIGMYEQWRAGVDVRTLAVQNGYTVAHARRIINQLRRLFAAQRKQRRPGR